MAQLDYKTHLKQLGIETCKAWDVEARVPKSENTSWDTYYQYSGISLACVVDLFDPWMGWEFYSDSDQTPYGVVDLSNTLKACDMTIGFNTVVYDHTVLRAMVPSHSFTRELDLFVHVIKPAVGQMRGKGLWGLNGFCERSFGYGKTATQGAFAPTLAKQGRWGELVTYNGQDVALLAKLFIHMLEQRTVVMPDGSPLEIGDQLDDAIERTLAREKTLAA